MPCPALPQSGIRDPKGSEAKWIIILGAVDRVKVSYRLKQNRKDLPQEKNSKMDKLCYNKQLLSRAWVGPWR